MKRICIVLFCAMIIFCAANLSQGEADKVIIQDGRKVAFDYTLTVDGKIVDSSKGRGPLEYTHGTGAIISGLSRQLEGMTAGDEKEVTISPEEAYGAVNPNAFREVPRSSLPATIIPEVGMLLQAQSADGQSFRVKIAEIKKDTVVLDYNHPLAGKTLHFQIKIVSIQ